MGGRRVRRRPAGQRASGEPRCYGIRRGRLGKSKCSGATILRGKQLWPGLGAVVGVGEAIYVSAGDCGGWGWEGQKMGPEPGKGRQVRVREEMLWATSLHGFTTSRARGARGGVGLMVQGKSAVGVSTISVRGGYFKVVRRPEEEGAPREWFGTLRSLGLGVVLGSGKVLRRNALGFLGGSPLRWDS